MSLFSAGPLRVRGAGGADREGGGDGPAILLCHGYGAPGDDLVSLHRVVAVPQPVRWFFPEAPLEVQGAGRAWWPIDMLRIQLAIMAGTPREMAKEKPDGLDEAREMLSACIDALVSDHGVDPAKLVIGGFSQGAMLTTELTLVGGRRFAGLAVLSGTLLCEDRWQPRIEALGKDLHVVQSHGERDPILPFEYAVELAERFQKAGARSSFVRFRGGHEIPGPALQALQSFVNARLALRRRAPARDASRVRLAAIRVGAVERAHERAEHRRDPRRERVGRVVERHRAVAGDPREEPRVAAAGRLDPHGVARRVAVLDRELEVEARARRELGRAHAFASAGFRGCRSPSFRTSR